MTIATIPVAHSLERKHCAYPFDRQCFHFISVQDFSLCRLHNTCCGFRAFGTPNTCPSDFRTQQSETRGHLILDGGNRDLSILSRCKLHELSERTVGTHATCSSMAPEEDASSLARDDNKPSWTRISLSNNVDKWLSFGWREGRSSSLDCDGCSCNNNNNDAQQRRSPEKQRSSISGFLRSVGVRRSNPFLTPLQTFSAKALARHRGAACATWTTRQSTQATCLHLVATCLHISFRYPSTVSSALFALDVRIPPSQGLFER